MSGRDSPKIVIEKRKIDGNDGSGVQAPAGARASRESRQDTRTDKKLLERSTARLLVAPWIALCDPQRGEGGGDDAARREPSTHRAFTHLQKWVST